MTAIFSIIPWRPVVDVVFDCSMVFIAVVFSFGVGIAAFTLAACVIGNRQRALANLLHEAVHNNLYRTGLLNERFAAVFISASLTSDLGLYRRAHSRHHAFLGRQGKDPDVNDPPANVNRSWWIVYRDQIVSVQAWLGAIFSRLMDRRLTWKSRAWMGLWWAALIATSCAINGASFTIYFVAL